MTIQADGKQAVTHYRVLEELPLTAFVGLNLETGRTHQIRVHMSSIGHPVFGDPTYGGRNKQLAGLNHRDTLFAAKLLKQFTRQMLHAHTLAFVHPRTEKVLRFESPLPADMQELLQLLRDRIA
jgi:23S rRNA pseudouridine1911/1915/1917 synthase